MYFFSTGGKFKESTVAVWCQTNCFLIRFRQSHNKLAGIPTIQQSISAMHHLMPANWILCTTKPYRLLKLYSYSIEGYWHNYLTTAVSQLLSHLQLRATGHFGPETVQHWDTLVLFRWVRSVWTFRHQYQSVQKTLCTLVPNGPVPWSELSCCVDWSILPYGPKCLTCLCQVSTCKKQLAWFPAKQRSHRMQHKQDAYI